MGLATIAGSAAVAGAFDARWIVLGLSGFPDRRRQIAAFQARHQSHVGIESHGAQAFRGCGPRGHAAERRQTGKADGERLVVQRCRFFIDGGTATL